jgi:hypothetical protein
MRTPAGDAKFFDALFAAAWRQANAAVLAALEAEATRRVKLHGDAVVAQGVPGSAVPGSAGF